MSNKSIITLVVMGVIIVALIAVSSIMVDIITVEGNQIGVLETWADGVADEPKLPKTYVLIPGFMKKIFRLADLGGRIFVETPEFENFSKN